MLAAVGSGAHEDVWGATAALRSPESGLVEPTTDPAFREIYDRRYRVFKSLYPALRELFGELRAGCGLERRSPVTGKTR